MVSRSLSIGQRRKRLADVSRKRAGRAVFKIAIVGRPNVGKSSLFNRLTRARKAIVGDEPGITRDRLYGAAFFDGNPVELIDTGGIIPEDKDLIPAQVLQQAQVAIQESDLILLIVDGRDGPTHLDVTLVELLRNSGHRFCLVVNKIDSQIVEDLLFQFYGLGVNEIFAVSAEHGRGIEELLDKLCPLIPQGKVDVEEREATRVAIIGRPNMGKSSILNRLLGQERAIVTDIPGTTRDSIDTVLEHGAYRYRLVDTAGIRRKGKTQGLVEKMSVVMARKNIAASDVVLLVLDATEGATKLDATIGGYAHDEGKSLIVVVNKWDLVEKDTHTAWQREKEIRMRMRFLSYAPLVFTSAKSGQRVFRLLEHVNKAKLARRKRIPTAEVNRFLVEKIEPRIQTVHGDRQPLMYVSQTGLAPPTFVLFTRTRKKLHFSTERFFINQIRQVYEFYATPIRIRQRLRK
jgi:GTP-binding protein